MNILSYERLKEDIFEKISPKEKEDLFFSSLFDPSSWEEIHKVHFSKDFAKYQNTALKTLRKNQGIKKEIRKNKEVFCRDFIQSERLSNYLLAYQIEKSSNQEIQADATKLSKMERDFPDISLQNGENIAFIEVKRLITADDLEERVKNEVIGAINKDKDKFQKIILLLLFPVLPREKAHRIYQLVKGYYVYQTIICKETDINCKVLCNCFKPDDEIHNLEELGKRIVKNLYEIF